MRRGGAALPTSPFLERLEDFEWPPPDDQDTVCVVNGPAATNRPEPPIASGRPNAGSASPADLDRFRFGSTDEHVVHDLLLFDSEADWQRTAGSAKIPLASSSRTTRTQRDYPRSFLRRCHTAAAFAAGAFTFFVVWSDYPLPALTVRVPASLSRIASRIENAGLSIDFTKTAEPTSSPTFEAPDDRQRVEDLPPAGTPQPEVAPGQQSVRIEPDRIAKTVPSNSAVDVETRGDALSGDVERATAGSARRETPTDAQPPVDIVRLPALPALVTGVDVGRPVAIEPPPRRAVADPAPPSRSGEISSVPRPASEAAGTGQPTDEQRIMTVLRRYANAYEQLDADAAREVWPTVDARALSRAFEGLESQAIIFERCDLIIATDAARASCQGTASYVPKVGSKTAHMAKRQWIFQLNKSGSDWQIARTETR